MSLQRLKNKVRLMNGVDDHSDKPKIVQVVLVEDVDNAVRWLKQKVYSFSENEGINMSSEDCVELINQAFEDVTK